MQAEKRLITLQKQNRHLLEKHLIISGEWSEYNAPQNLEKQIKELNLNLNLPKIEQIISEADFFDALTPSSQPVIPAQYEDNK